MNPPQPAAPAQPGPAVVAAARTRVTLVAGGKAGQREALIAAALAPGQSGAVILEGLADASSALAALAGGASAHPANAAAMPSDASGHAGAAAQVLPQITRIAPGCLCCAGNLVLRVTLNRLLRRPPAQLFISLADATHIEQLRLWLAGPQYQLLLQPEPDLIAGQ